MKQAAAMIICGQVMHERLRPVRHRFVYPVFYLRVNLARLDELNSRWFGIDRWRPAALRLRDYGPRDGSDLQQWMRGLLSRQGIEADGEIWLQTFPRLFGYAFNPVSFWYCHDRNGALRAVLAEVNNTFGESHRYLLSTSEAIGANSILTSRKNLHVSPFCQVQGSYQFRFCDGEHSNLVKLDYADNQGVLIKTSIGGKVVPFSVAEIRRAVLRQPLLTFGIIAGIHWQAFRLWRRKVPWFYKPEAPQEQLSHVPHSPANQEESIS